MTTIRVEDISDVKKKVFFEIPLETVNERLDSEYRDLKKGALIKGFRKGKVPLDVLKMYFKAQVEADTARKIIEDTLQPGIDERKFTLISVLNVEPDQLTSEKPFTYWAEIEVAPSVEPVGYKGMKLRKVLRTVTDDDVTTTLEALRGRYAKLIPPQDNRGARKGDHLVVDVDAAMGDLPVAQLTLKDYPMELGKAVFIKDLDEKLLEAREGDEIRFSIPMPSYLAQVEGGTDTVDLTVRVKELKERTLPDLDDAFAKDLGRHETIDELRAEIKLGMEKRAEIDAGEALDRQIVDRLVETHSFEAPERLVEAEIDTLLSRARAHLIGMGHDPDALEAADPTRREKVRAAADRNVKAGIIIKAICECEAIELTPADVEEEVKNRAVSLGWTVDHLKDQLEIHNMWEGLRGSVLQKKVMDFVTANAEITESDAPENTESDQRE